MPVDASETPHRAIAGNLSPGVTTPASHSGNDDAVRIAHHPGRPVVSQRCHANLSRTLYRTCRRDRETVPRPTRIRRHAGRGPGVHMTGISSLRSKSSASTDSLISSLTISFCRSNLQVGRMDNARSCPSSAMH